ncbi:kinesin K39, partial [Halomonas sp. SUBG004]
DIEARQEQLARLETQLSEWRDELSTLDERLHVDDPASGNVPNLTGEQQTQQDGEDGASGAEGENAQADEAESQQSGS